MTSVSSHAFKLLSIVLVLGAIGPVQAERVYPPWLRDEAPDPVYPGIYVDADYVVERYGRDDCELLSLHALTPDQAEVLAGRHGGALTGQLSLRGTRWCDGHIPHSLPLDPDLLLDADGAVPEGTELREALQQLGARPSTPIDLGAEFILCGGTPQQQGLGYLLLRQAGVDSVRIYPGGIYEWRLDVGRPVVRIVETEELRGMMSREREGDGLPRDFVLMDLRHFTDFAEGTLPGAVSMPSHEFEAGFRSQLDTHWPEADRLSTPLVFFCYGTDCIRSRNAATKAARLGWRDIRWYHGGVEEWQTSGHDLVIPRASYQY